MSDTDCCSRAERTVFKSRSQSRKNRHCAYNAACCSQGGRIQNGQIQDNQIYCQQQMVSQKVGGKSVSGQCRVFLSCVVLMLLAACSSARVLTEWPDTTPDQGVFLRAYNSDRNNQQAQSTVEYLTWVVRFYEGWELMPTGWNAMTPVILSDLDTQQANEVAQLRDELGMLIAAEWAKDNEHRVIDTGMLSLWGGVMVAALEPQVRIDAIELITRDVEQLLTGELAPSRITDARYTERLPIRLD